MCSACPYEAQGVPEPDLQICDLQEAARMYDAALVRLRGTAAATNFALSDYRLDLAAYHKMQQVWPARLPENVPSVWRLSMAG